MKPLGGCALILMNLFLASSALGQVKLPPEEIGFINQRTVNELARWAPSEKSQNIDVIYLQKLLEQDPENKCSHLEEFIGPTTSSVLKSRLERAKRTSPLNESIDQLICGIEEFVLYDATQENFFARRILNRARQLVLNTRKLQNHSGPIDLVLLKNAFDLAIPNTQLDGGRGVLQYLYGYTLSGIDFVNLIKKLLPTILSESMKARILEYTATWYASDLASGELFGKNAALALEIMTAVSTNRNVEARTRAQSLLEVLNKPLEK